MSSGKSKFNHKFRNAKITTQMIIMFIVAVMLPMFVAGGALITTNITSLTEYHRNLVQSNNDRVRSILYEITSQIHNISGDIAYDKELIDMLSQDYVSEDEFKATFANYDTMDYFITNYTGIDDIRIYIDKKNVPNYKCFYKVTTENRYELWYKEASTQFSVFWESVYLTDSFGNSSWTLALVRRITLNDDSVAVLVMSISDNYLKNRIETTDYSTILSMNDREVFYSSNRDDYGKSELVDIIDPTQLFFTYIGNLAYHGNEYMASISTLKMASSPSSIYVTTISNTAYDNIKTVTYMTLIILLLAIILPGILMGFFIRFFTRQINDLRYEMNKASNENYDLSGFDGSYELNMAYSDLQLMVEKIKDQDEKMYNGKITEQILMNEQQKMEFQMLASQINPHFLYNTLETIRMKAITAGDRETATAIQLLGRSMRYVLDNTGTQYTTIAKEISHIETYLQIQKLRFGDRVNYEFKVDDGLDPDEILILPLLLQPIVENAILHGLEEVESGGMILFHVHRSGDGEDVRIDITDNGCGMDPLELKKMQENLDLGNIDKRYGIGLYNINQRIKLCYGQQYGLTIESIQGKGTTVSATIKIMRKEEKAENDGGDRSGE